MQLYFEYEKKTCNVLVADAINICKLLMSLINLVWKVFNNNYTYSYLHLYDI